MRSLVLLLCLLSTGFLSSCGSSGEQKSSSPTPPAPEVPPPVTETPPPANPAIPAGGSLIITSTEALAPVTYLGDASEPIARVSVVNVTHSDFSQALQVDVLKPTGEFWDGQILLPISSAVSQDDVILAHLFLRSVASSYETGSSFTTLFMESPGPEYHKFT